MTLNSRWHSRDLVVSPRALGDRLLGDRRHPRRRDGGVVKRPASFGQVTWRLARNYLLLLAAVFLAFAIVIGVSEPNGRICTMAHGQMRTTCR